MGPTAPQSTLPDTNRHLALMERELFNWVRLHPKTMLGGLRERLRTSKAAGGRNAHEVEVLRDTYPEWHSDELLMGDR